MNARSHEENTDGRFLLEIQEGKRHYIMGENVIRAMDGVDLKITPGEFLIIVGSSGSGKSTIMHVLGCLDNLTGGRYLIRGQDTSRYSDELFSAARNRRIGFVFQQFNLLSDLTVLENIALPLSYSGVSTQRRLEIAHRQAAALGLENRLNHRPTELSGGQAQRVAIARALVNDPDILLADEPTGNLDSVTGREIIQVFLDLNAKGLTIIMVTHDLEIAKLGTRKITVHDGKIIKDEPLNHPAAAKPDISPSASHPEKPAGLGFFDLLRIGVKEGLMCHKMRTALTMLGIVIGVAAVIAMSSLSLGSKKKQADQIRALGANLMRVIDNRLEGEAMLNARKKGSRGLTMTDLNLIRDNVPDILNIGALRELKVNCLFQGRSIFPRVVGVMGNYLQVNNLTVHLGREISDMDQHRCARIAVVGSAIVKQMRIEDPLGKFLLLGGDPYMIVGVLDNKQIDTKELEATSLTDSNYDLIIPLNTMLTRTSYLEMRNEIDELHLQLKTEDRLYDVGTEVKRLLEIAHDGVDDFKIVIPLDLLKQKQQAQRLLDVLTILIASISLIVGGIGIMNIMLAAVTERIREIGIRRAVGATKKDIRHQFLSESILLSITGGCIGVLLAIGVTVIAGFLLSIPIVISMPMICISVLAATGIGLGFGLYPAVQAANKHPVEALRYE